MYIVCACSISSLSNYNVHVTHLSNSLDVTEGSSTGTLGDQVDSLVDAAHGRHVDSLATHNTTGTNTGGILTGGRVDEGINELLDGVGVGEQVDNVKSVLDDANGHDLLAVVAAVHHERAGKTLHDRALGLLEALLLEATSSHRHELRELRLHGEVVLQGDITNGDIIVTAPTHQHQTYHSYALTHDTQLGTY